MSAKHRTSIEWIGGGPGQDQGRPYLACSCGWCGPQRSTAAAAIEDENAHLRAVEKQEKAGAHP